MWGAALSGTVVKKAEGTDGLGALAYFLLLLFCIAGERGWREIGNLDVLLDEVRMKLIATSLLKPIQLGKARCSPSPSGM